VAHTDAAAASSSATVGETKLAVPVQAVAVPVPEEPVELVERWMISFTLQSFERFCNRHVDAIEPDSSTVRRFVEEFVKGVDTDAFKVRDLFSAIKVKHGAFREPFLDVAKNWASSAILKQRKVEQEKQKLMKSKKGSEGQPVKRDVVAVEVDTGSSTCAKIEDIQDVKWAASILVPWGFRADKTDEPIFRAPAKICLRVFNGLQHFHQKSIFREAMKQTQIGKVVNCMRRHENTEVGKLARTLVQEWKVACARKEPASKAAPTQ